MIGLTIFAGLLVAVVGAWLLVETHRAGRNSRWLALVIPGLIAWPVAIQFYGASLLGYATADELGDEFVLIHAYADEQHKAVYALVRAKGEADPRLYVITKDYEQARKAFAQAQTSVAKGVPVAGRQLRAGLDDAGAFLFYQLPSAGIPSKG